MATEMSTRRLRKEYLAICRQPVENIQAVPLESNILEWHYVITGTQGTAYEGGYYHGKLKFPPEYPMKPPSVLMLTPNGRFATSRRLCLSMSDFHPETWNPVWSVSTILMGLYSFMLEQRPTLGSITSTTVQKRKFANESLLFNCKDKNFCKLFPELVALQERRTMAMANTSKTTNPSSKNQGPNCKDGPGARARGNATKANPAMSTQGNEEAKGDPIAKQGAGTGQGVEGGRGLMMWAMAMVFVGVAAVAVHFIAF